MRVISLFSGIGGICLAMSHAGFDIVAQVEINEYCRKVLKHHAPKYWQNSTQFTDVRDFGRPDINGEIDLIAGGFPCQPFSIAGARKGADDNRNLWGEFRRIISEFRPRAILLENVPAICSAYVDADGNRRPAYALTVIADLAQMGYDAQWGVIAAAEAGAMHERKRWYCVAYLPNSSGNRSRQSPTEQNASHQRADDSPPTTGQGLRQPNEIESGGEVSDTNGKRLEAPNASELRTGTTGADTGQANSGERLAGLEVSNAYEIGCHDGSDHRKERYLPADSWATPKGEPEWQGRQRGISTIGEVQHPTSAGLERSIRGELQRNQYPEPSGRESGELLVSGMGYSFNGFPRWLVGHRRVAPPLTEQYEWEHPRTIPVKTPNHKQEIMALGNAVFVPVVFSLCLGIADRLLGE